jgi:hypothetical protein
MGKRNDSSGHGMILLGLENDFSLWSPCGHQHTTQKIKGYPKAFIVSFSEWHPKDKMASFSQSYGNHLILKPSFKQLPTQGANKKIINSGLKKH